MLNSDRLEERKKNFQKLPDEEEVKRKRDETIVQLRKKKRSDHIAKKRALMSSSGKTAQDSEAISSGPLTFEPHKVPQALANIEPRLIEESLSHSQRLSLLISFIQSSQNPTELNLAVQTLRGLISFEYNSPVEAIGGLDIHKKLIECLSFDNKNLAYEAMWCLTNLASGPTHIVRKLVAEGAVEALSKFINSSEPELVDQAVWALGNISGDSVEHRNAVCNSGVAEVLIRNISTAKTMEYGVMTNSMWVLSNLVRGHPGPSNNLVREVLGVVPKVINLDYEETLAETLWLLANASEGDTNRIQLVLNTGTVQRVISLLMHSNNRIKTGALRTIGNICTGDEVQTQTIIDNGGLDKIEAVLSVGAKRVIKKEALWTLSNIAAGSAKQSYTVVSHSVFRFVKEGCSEVDYEVRKEALFVIANATFTGKEETIRKGLEKGILKLLVENLENDDSRLLTITLETIKNVLKANKEHVLLTNQAVDKVSIEFDELGGLNFLERLQSHPNQTVYDLSVEIITNYFGVDETPDQEDFRIPGKGFNFE